MQDNHPDKERQATRKLNCWEHFECEYGPKPDDPNSMTCRAGTEHALDGLNGGINGGRVCWAVAGTLGVDDPSCVHSVSCSTCTFRKLVFTEESPDFVDSFGALERLGYGDALTLSSLRPEMAPDHD